MNFVFYAIVLSGAAFGANYGLDLGHPFWLIASWLCALAAGYYMLGLRVISEWERCPVMSLGRFVRTAGPGISWIDPIFHTYLPEVAVRDFVQSADVTNIQTKDNIPISFRLLLTMRIQPEKIKEFTIRVKDGIDSVVSRAIASVTEHVGMNDLETILHSRADLSERIRNELQHKIFYWGIEIEAVELTNINIADPAIEQAIAMKARAKREADAELVRAEMQREVAHRLNEAAAALTPEGWELKRMEVFVEVGRNGQNNAFIIPSKLLDAFANVAAPKSDEKK